MGNNYYYLRLIKMEMGYFEELVNDGQNYGSLSNVMGTLIPHNPNGWEKFKAEFMNCHKESENVFQIYINSRFIPVSKATIDFLFENLEIFEKSEGSKFLRNLKLDRVMLPECCFEVLSNCGDLSHQCSNLNEHFLANHDDDLRGDGWSVINKSDVVDDEDEEEEEEEEDEEEDEEEEDEEEEEEEEEDRLL